jgi:hypothetical protein
VNPDNVNHIWFTYESLCCLSGYFNKQNSWLVKQSEPPKRCSTSSSNAYSSVYLVCCWYCGPCIPKRRCDLCYVTLVDKNPCSCFARNRLWYQSPPRQDELSHCQFCCGHCKHSFPWSSNFESLLWLICSRVVLITILY